MNLSSKNNTAFLPFLGLLRERDVNQNFFTVSGPWMNREREWLVNLNVKVIFIFQKDTKKIKKKPRQSIKW